LARVQRRKQLAICSGNHAAAVVPFAGFFQLGAQHRGLDRIEPRVVTANLMRVVGQSAVIAGEGPQFKWALESGRVTFTEYLNGTKSASLICL
jgi:hypothetical protein